MTKTKSTKRSLLSSVLALFLCVAMLAGTTFAWFTDSVTAQNNVIKSGNLDVEFDYWNGTEWKTVKDASDILAGDRWEPGYTDVAYLRFRNAGSLALKYQLGVNIVSETAGKTAEGVEFLLSDYIYYDVAEGVNGETDAYATREDAMAIATETTLISENYGKQGTLAAKSEYVYLAMVVYMPKTVGNEANHNGTDIPQIDLGINILATQTEAELDAFGDDYDKDAWHPEMKVYNAGDLQAAINNGATEIVLMDDITLTESIVIPAAAATTFSMRSTPVPTVINLNGKTINNANGYVFESQGHLVIDGNGTVTGLGGIRAKAGTVTINGGNYYASSRWQDGTSQHTLKAENTVVTINGGNFDATVNGQTNAMFNASTEAVITINGGSFKNVATELGKFDPYLFTYENNGKLIINDGVFYGGWRFNGETATTDIYGGTFTVGFDGQSFNASSTHKVTVYGGTFVTQTNAGLTNKVGDLVADGLVAIDNGDGTYKIMSDEYASSVAPGVYLSEDGTVYGIVSEAGWTWVADQADAYFCTGKTPKTIKLEADIDFGGKEAPHIRFWNSGEGAAIFDGNEHTLSKFIAPVFGDSTGLFSGTLSINNLTVDDAVATGRYVGIFAGKLYGNIDNCTVKNSTVTGTYWQTGVLVGQYNSGNVTNCTVDNCTINGMAAVGGLVGILNENAGVRKIENCTVKNCDINQNGSFDGDYDKMFGLAIGCVNVENATVYVTNCTMENNTMFGEKSDLACGFLWCASTTVWVDDVIVVSSADALQKQLDAATDGTTIMFTCDIDGNVTVVQKPDTKITVDGNGNVLNGGIFVNGKSARYAEAGLTIQNVIFDADALPAGVDAYIRLGNGDDATRYTNNVTVKDCTFVGENYNYVGVKSFTGGDRNLTLDNCTADSGMHSLAQLKNVEQGLKIVNCKAYSKNGVNVNNTPAMEMIGCTFAVQGYAVRFGESANTTDESFTIKNSTLESACAEEGDAVIEFRQGASNATLTLTNTTLVGTPNYKGEADATIIVN